MESELISSISIQFNNISNAFMQEDQYYID